MRLILFSVFVMAFATSAFGQLSDSVLIQEGAASFYGKRFHLRMTSNGEIFNMDSLTAAHKYLPFGTWVKVTRVDTKDSVWVRINDRLPKTSKRIIDLSRGAAKELDMIKVGIALVRLEVPTIADMNRLYKHFDGEAPGTIRVRIYEKPIVIPRPQPSWSWKVGNLRINY
jgi:rare lipoprotein A